MSLSQALNQFAQNLGRYPCGKGSSYSRIARFDIAGFSIVIFIGTMAVGHTDHNHHDQPIRQPHHTAHWRSGRLDA